MLRVLQVVNKMDRAGLETMLMNYYRHVDKSKIQFDFIAHRPDEGDYDREIESMGGRIFRAPRLYPQNYLKHFIFMKNFFINHPEYQIVHSHIDSMSIFPLYCAKKANVKLRIAHSHTTGFNKDSKYILKNWFKKLIPYCSNYYLACGKDAYEFLFNEDCINTNIVSNAINSQSYRYDIILRNEMRMKYNLKDKFVIGHVGSFTYPKNHVFLLDVFKKICEFDNNCILLLIGKGEKEDEIKSLVEKYGLQHNVILMGQRSDVNLLLQAIDCFVLPSLFEGVPLVGIEAQASGLPCVFSENVSSEVMLTENCEFISLNESVKYWAKSILHNKSYHRRDTFEQILSSGYDITNQSKKLQQFYLSKAKEMKILENSNNRA